jgi:hypothetical protein
MYRGMGFDISEDLKVWIDKFINKCASDNGFDITDCAYILFNDEGTLRANMYYRKELVQNLPSFMGIGTSISIDYIMQTS